MEICYGDFVKINFRPNDISYLVVSKGVAMGKLYAIEEKDINNL